MAQALCLGLLSRAMQGVHAMQLVRLCPSCDAPMERRERNPYTAIEFCRQCGLTVLAARPGAPSGRPG